MYAERLNSNKVINVFIAVHLNIVGEFGIGDIANRFVAGIDAMRNIRDLGPIYNQGIMNSDINIDNPNYTSPVAEHKMVTATPINITISKLLVLYSRYSLLYR